jgi:hypothetical protein
LGDIEALHHHIDFAILRQIYTCMVEWARIVGISVLPGLLDRPQNCCCEGKALRAPSDGVDLPDVLAILAVGLFKFWGNSHRFLAVLTEFRPVFA